MHIFSFMKTLPFSMDFDITGLGSKSSVDVWHFVAPAEESLVDGR